MKFPWVGLLLLASLGCASAPARPALVVAPYAQPGDGPSTSMRILWGSREAGWSVRYRTPTGWRSAPSPAARPLYPDGVEPFHLYETTLADLPPDAEVQYEVLHPDAHAPVRAALRTRTSEEVRFALWGDGGSGSEAQKAIARQVLRQDPDVVVVAGDVMQGKGRQREYLVAGFPVYNSETVPLMRARVFLPMPGNHDLTAGGPDPYGYYVFFRLPHNGPRVAGPRLPEGEARERFLTAAGSEFPVTGTYSIDWGPVHWTLLDTTWNDWSRPELRSWVAADLASSRQPWKLAVVHQSPFSSARAHRGDQQARWLCELFQEGGVQVVFSGHVHTYQRSRPITFYEPRAGKGHQVFGEYRLDRTFDGEKNTRPAGIVYIVSGAGGAHITDGEMHDNPALWAPFTAVMKTREHSFTLGEASRSELWLRQLDAAGRELDRVRITR